MASSATKAAVAAAAVVALVGGGAYWYFSPFVVVRTMQKAAKARDADTFNEHVDYPRLRESLKGQFAAMMAGKVADSDSDAERAGMALGSLLGGALVDRFVDVFVRPETVMRAMAQADVRLEPDPTQPPPSSDDPAPARPRHKIVWSYDRVGVDKVLVYGRREGDDDSRRVGLVLERSGFANWKLTELRLPTSR